VQLAAFNGDADGLCALQQLRLWGGLAPQRLFTGVKRDIALLERVSAGPGDELWVLDVAVEKNRPALDRLLERGARVRWFDHHHPGPLPGHPGLEAHLDIAAEVNTSLIVYRHLAPPAAGWAVMGLFGDNMDRSARGLARDAGLAEGLVEELARAGRLLNYNAYGEQVEDLHYPPAELAGMMAGYADPAEFIAGAGVIAGLEEGRARDLARAEAAERLAPGVVRLPAEPWARRVVGELANRLARREPDSAHAVLVDDGRGGVVVSLRRPLAGGPSAAELARRFATGGGRDKAAGINRLPDEQVGEFVERFRAHFG
jgi:hypothetical protein